LIGCSVERYRPAPLIPADSAMAFEARRLSNSGLRAFEEAALGRSISPWPLVEWDLQSLSLAAEYFNPELAEARARAAESQAALLTAQRRPNPTVNLSPGIPSPYLLTLDLSFPVETAGKRGYRILEARSLDEAARFDLAQAVWAVHSAVRAALLGELTALRTLDTLRSEGQAREEQVGILERTAAAGEIPRLEVDAARIELSKVRSAADAARGEVAESTAALAAAMGVPLAALRETHLSWTGLDAPPAAQTLSSEEIKRDAVLNRLDVRAALARYAAAEAELQLEIAKQYPDLNIGPGYTYEQRDSFFSIGLSATLPLFDRNRGPIAEAEARRTEAAAAFVETQARVIQRSEGSLEVYSAALNELTDAESLVRLIESRQQALERSVRLGEEDRLELVDTKIQLAVATRARVEALARAQRALGDLEDAVERPLAAGDELPAAQDLTSPKN